MYKRRTKEYLFELGSSFMKDKFYQRLYKALKWVEIHYDELSPEEVWDEVMGEIGRVISMPRPELQLPDYLKMLRERYSSFRHEDGTIIQRSLSQTSLSTFLVVFGIMYRLLPLKEDYSETISHLLEAICYHELFVPFKERVAECENVELDRNNFIQKGEEKISGHMLKPRSLKSNLYTDAKPDSWFITKHESKEISHSKLKDFFDRHFINHLKNKYEWVALYLFCKQKHLDAGQGDAKSFMVEMSKTMWYPNRSNVSYQGSIQPYLYLATDTIDGEIQWNCREKVNQQSIDKIRQIYERLLEHFAYANIYK